MAFSIINDNHIARFTITRPAIRNAINHEVMQGLEQLIELVHNDSTIKFVVITGEGTQAFCSGGDLSVFHGLKTAAEAFPMLNKMAQILYKVSTLPVPVIALVNGAAVGGGCEIATACDYRLVSSTAKCGFIQGSLAITSGWGGGTYLLEKMPQMDQALRMLGDSKPYSANRLKEMRWATELYEGDSEVALQTFIQDMGKIDASVHRAYKEMVNRKWTSLNLLNQIQEEVIRCSELWEADAHHIQVQKFLNRGK
ncbi:enoyl-CoA hydratase/isomerase family protein [Paenisporosarcina quisquiliarum]|uniref:enoyl-CoA hydratase/isomerase family protein n=1 Tax=Paenisporosarcina quisquiliarum TaxID=365346 RepID=UPI0037350896